MVKKSSIALSKWELYEAVRLYVHDIDKVHMPPSSSLVSMEVDEDRIVFEWVEK